MSKILAKFKVVELTKYGNEGIGKVILFPVFGDTDENKQFWKCTPSGQIEMQIDNPETYKHFEEMGEFYVTFEKVEPNKP